MAEEPKVGDLVSSAVADVQTLVRGQMELAVTEMKSTAKTVATGSGLLIGAAIFGFLAFVFGLVAAAYGLVKAGLPEWAGFLIVAVLLLGIAALLGGLGNARTKKAKGPEATARQIEATKNLLSKR